MSYRKWRIIPTIRYVNMVKEFPILRASDYALFSFQRYWSGAIIYIGFRHHQLIFDFRYNVLNDLARKKMMDGPLL